MTSCPNCGAAITGPRCEYCGTVFDATRLGVKGFSIDVYSPSPDACWPDRVEMVREMVFRGAMSVNEARRLMLGVE